MKNLWQRLFGKSKQEQAQEQANELFSVLLLELHEKRIHAIGDSRYTGEYESAGYAVFTGEWTEEEWKRFVEHLSVSLKERFRKASNRVIQETLKVATFNALHPHPFLNIEQSDMKIIHRLLARELNKRQPGYLQKHQQEFLGG